MHTVARVGTVVSNGIFRTKREVARRSVTFLSTGTGTELWNSKVCPGDMADSPIAAPTIHTSFKLLSSGEWTRENKSRHGRLEHCGRWPMLTPHYIGVTSRGAVPHLTQDTMVENTSIKGVYTAFEDCES